MEIVGVAKTSKYIFIAEPPTDFVYLPYRQNKPQRMILVAQSAGDPASAGRRRCARWCAASTSNMPIFNVRTMEELYRMRAVSIFNVLVTHRGAMGLMGLGLSIVGLYGLVAYAAAGARGRSASAWRSAPTVRPCCGWCCGRASCWRSSASCVGLVASVGAGELLRAAFPSGDDQRDVLALVLVAPVVLAVTFLAAYIPARRASRVNPMQALRYE